ncbi:hypothetical protein [Lysobacter sp. CA199]|uniref:hypothetical protein n=1 Tax=Lysobacter sp. CA199 TaxID=3455608 RepID=UPI003F8D4179
MRIDSPKCLLSTGLATMLASAAVAAAELPTTPAERAKLYADAVAQAKQRYAESVRAQPLLKPQPRPCGLLLVALMPPEGTEWNWSGACKDGAAEGTGIADVYYDGKHKWRYIGAMSAGARSGAGEMLGASGYRVKGDYAEDELTGQAYVVDVDWQTVGKITYVDGTREGPAWYASGDGSGSQGRYRDGTQVDGVRYPYEGGVEKVGK